MSIMSPRPWSAVNRSDRWFAGVRVRGHQGRVAHHRPGLLQVGSGDKTHTLFFLVSILYSFFLNTDYTIKYYHNIFV